MDIEAAKALAVVYGNYRSAITSFDMCADKDVRRVAAEVVACAKALLACQEAFKCEVADVAQVNSALEEARAAYIAA